MYKWPLKSTTVSRVLRYSLRVQSDNTVWEYSLRIHWLYWEHATYGCWPCSVEVSVRGQISKENQKALVFRSCVNPVKMARKMIQNASKPPLLTSFTIFSARKEPSWTSPTPLVISWSFVFYVTLFMFTCLLFRDDDLCESNIAFMHFFVNSQVATFQFVYFHE